MHILIRDKRETSISSNREIKLSKGEETISRTDIHGNIIYYNNTFSKISGYGKKELLRTPHSMLRHPDMPKAIFYFIWKTLLAGNSTYAIIKNITKDGEFYWQLIKFSVQKDRDNKTVSFLSKGRDVSVESIKKIEPLYNSLLKNEKENNMHSSIKSMLAFLNYNNIATYNDYICNICPKKKYTPFFRFKF